MASAAPAYRMDYSQQPLERPSRQPQVHVVGGRRPAESVSPGIILAAKTFVVVLIAVALIGCVRVALSTATVSTMLQSESLEAQTATMRTSATDLEVKESTMSSSSNVKNAATQLGMGEAAQTTTIVLDQDVVSYDAAGNLSLSQSLAVASRG